MTSARSRRASLAIEEPHAHGDARVVAGVAVVDLPGEPGAAFGRGALGQRLPASALVGL